MCRLERWAKSLPFNKIASTQTTHIELTLTKRLQICRIIAARFHSSSFFYTQPTFLRWLSKCEFLVNLVFDECCGSPSLSANRGEHVFEKDWGSSVTRELGFDEDCDLMRVEDLSSCLQDKSSVFVSVDNVGRKSTYITWFFSKFSQQCDLLPWI